MKGGKLLFVLFSLALLTSQCWSSSPSNQATSLREFIKSRSSKNPPNAEPWEQEPEEELPSVYVASQLGRMEADEIEALPGQPEGVDFRQYSGYVTVDPDRGRALFYYFVESPQDPASKPLLLWLTGGPTCSSLGLGAMVELGPFRVNSDGETLSRNEFAWNIVANVIFLESPAGVGFSYSNTSSDYATGDKRTAQDSYIFLVNWLERFPRYKHRDLFIVGESYAGHFAPQLAQTIMSHSNRTTGINLKGIAIGNGWFDEGAGIKGKYEFYWTHALNSDETNAKINRFCDFDTGNFSSGCLQYLDQADNEIGNINPANIYEPSCHPPASLGSRSRAALPLALPSARMEKIAINLVNHFDPCSFGYVLSYLNRRPVQTALHAQTGEWKLCRGKISRWTDSPFTVSPTIKQLMDRGIRVWIYSGDVDPVVPITSSRYAINAMHLSVESAWRPWYTSQEVGGYVIGYKGLTFATVRGAGHLIPSDQPERVLTLISCFLNGTLPSSTS